MDFSAEQEKYLEEGNFLTSELQKQVEVALGITKLEYQVKRHYYIYSPPGAGKTFCVANTALRHDVKMVKFQGNTSIFAFVATIAAAAYIAAGKQVTVWVDDCDGLFMDLDGLNIMKGCLDEDVNTLTYSKSLFGYVQQLQKAQDPNSQLMAEALLSYQPLGGMGVRVPTNNMNFIVTSNLRLTPPSSDITSKRKMHESAIRDRVNYVEYSLDRGQNWGWVASQMLNNKVLDLSDAQKKELLCWMWNNWERMPSRSMRAVRELAATMLNNPTRYEASWNLTLTR